MPYFLSYASETSLLVTGLALVVVLVVADVVRRVRAG